MESGKGVQPQTYFVAVTGPREEKGLFCVFVTCITLSGAGSFLIAYSN